MMQTEPKNPHTLLPALFYEERNYKDLGALLPAVLQVIINSLGQCCSVPAELMFLNTPLPQNRFRSCPMTTRVQ